MEQKKLESHLGGHAGLTHLDHGALDWAIYKFGIKSYLDIGCGPGGMVNLAKSKNLKVKGIDGDYSLQRECSADYIIHDYSKGSSGLEETFDLCWSVEFVEHVYADYIENYAKDFTKAKYVILTYAPPGWPGHHHVNCQPEEYWIDAFKKYGLEYDEQHTKDLRKFSTMNTSNPRKGLSNTFVKDRGLFFKNTLFVE